MSTDEGRGAEQLLVDLTSRSALTRNRAASGLARHTPDQRAIGALLECLEDQDPVEPEDVYMSMEWAYGSSNPEVLQAAADTLCFWGSRLAAIDPQVFERLLTIFQTKNATARVCAVRVLGALRDPRAIDPLVDVLQEGITETSQEATKALGRLKDNRVLERLLQALQKALQEGNQSSIDAITHALGSLEDDQAIEPLLAALRVSATPEVMKALAKFKDARVVAALIALLPSAQAAEALWMAGDRLAIEPLIASLQASNVIDRSRAAEILGRFGAEQAIEPLIACLQDQEPSVRVGAAGALGSLRATPAVEPLIVCLQDQESDVRVAAIRALGNIGDLRGLKELVRIWVEKPRGYMRHQALYGVLKAKNPHAYEWLLDLIEGQDQEPGQERVQPQEPMQPWRGSVDPPIECLQDQDPYTRAMAARMLAKMGEVDASGYFAVRHLRSIVTNDPDNNVRYTALSALVKTKKQSVYYLLRDLVEAKNPIEAKDPELRQLASEALERWDTGSYRFW